MKRQYLVKIKNVIKMKKLVYLFVFAVVFGLTAFGLSSCDEAAECQGKLTCNDGGCCSYGYPYDDGHGTCWETLSGCRSTGWACSKCW